MSDNDMNATEIVIERYSQLVDSWSPDSFLTWSKGDKALYCIVGARCKMDIDGFSCLFEDGMTLDEVNILITALRDLDEPSLANCFDQALQELQRFNFYEEGRWAGREMSDEVEQRLDIIEKRIRADDKLWNLDEKLSRLVS